MKTFLTLLCFLFMTAGFAQQGPVKSRDSLVNIDNMPIIKGRGRAGDMPTRSGQGEALPMPNLSMPAPKERLKADSSNRQKPDGRSSPRKNKLP